MILWAALRLEDYPVVNIENNAKRAKVLIGITQTIDAEVSRITGLASRWDGTVAMIGDAYECGYWGAKDYSCYVEYAEQVADNRLLRISNPIHEMLHAHSVGYNMIAYPVFSEYEEGVVEHLTRIIRGEITGNLGEDPETDFSSIDQKTGYDNEMKFMESLRIKTGKEPRDFYLQLIRINLISRESVVKQWIAENQK